MLKVVEAFSGIGAQAKALERIKERNGYEYTILNTADWDINAIVAYDLIHHGAQDLEKYLHFSKKDLIERLEGYTLSPDGKEPFKEGGLKRCSKDILVRVLAAIERSKNLVSITNIAGNDLPVDIDVMTYSFPCQNLSIAGVMHGVMTGIDRNVKNRSGMLWEVERILKERDGDNEEGYTLPLPKFLLMENVTTLRSERHSRDFGEWKSFLESKGYYNIEYKLEADRFGIPQTRSRLFMISVWLGKNPKEYLLRKRILENYLEGKNLETDDEYIATFGIVERTLQDIICTDDEYATELRESVLNDTPSRESIVNNNITLLSIEENGVRYEKNMRTITTKQDRDPCAGLIEYPNDIVGKLNYRYLTPRECFLGMGFDHDDYQVLIDNNFRVNRGNMFFNASKIYKMAGNSIVVNILEAVFMQIYEIKDLLDV